MALELFRYRRPADRETIFLVIALKVLVLALAVLSVGTLFDKRNLVYPLESLGRSSLLQVRGTWLYFFRRGLFLACLLSAVPWL